MDTRICHNCREDLAKVGVTVRVLDPYVTRKYSFKNGKWSWSNQEVLRDDYTDIMYRCGKCDHIVNNDWMESEINALDDIERDVIFIDELTEV